MNDNSIMPYGKHQGEKLSMISEDYWMWMYDNEKLIGSLKRYVETKYWLSMLERAKRDD